MTSDNKIWINDDEMKIISSMIHTYLRAKCPKIGEIPYQELSGIASIAKDFIPPNDVLPYIGLKRFVNVSKSEIYYFLRNALFSVGIATYDPQYDLDHPMPCSQIGVLDDVKIFYERIADMINNSHSEFPDHFNEFFRTLTQCIENRMLNQRQELITLMHLTNLSHPASPPSEEGQNTQ